MQAADFLFQSGQLWALKRFNYIYYIYKYSLCLTGWTAFIYTLSGSIHVGEFCPVQVRPTKQHLCLCSHCSHVCEKYVSDLSPFTRAFILSAKRPTCSTEILVIWSPQPLTSPHRPETHTKSLQKLGYWIYNLSEFILTTCHNYALRRNIAFPAY